MKRKQKIKATPNEDLFRGRNQEYGGYQLRKRYVANLLIAMGVSAAAFCFVFVGWPAIQTHGEIGAFAGPEREKGPGLSLSEPELLPNKCKWVMITGCSPSPSLLASLKEEGLPSRPAMVVQPDQVAFSVPVPAHAINEKGGELEQSIEGDGSLWEDCDCPVKEGQPEGKPEDYALGAGYFFSPPPALNATEIRKKIKQQCASKGLSIASQIQARYLVNGCGEFVKMTLEDRTGASLAETQVEQVIEKELPHIRHAHCVNGSESPPFWFVFSLADPVESEIPETSTKIQGAKKPKRAFDCDCGTGPSHIDFNELPAGETVYVSAVMPELLNQAEVLAEIRESVAGLDQQVDEKFVARIKVDRCGTIVETSCPKPNLETNPNQLPVWLAIEPHLYQIKVEPCYAGPRTEDFIWLSLPINLKGL